MEAVYTQYRPYLFSVAYNILGEIQEAEDLVQDAFEDLLGTDANGIKNIKSYLTRVVANKSIDRLHVLKKQREHYPGTWLPEPIITPADGEPQEGILQYEVLHALNQLNPTERAAFVLRTAFDYPYRELSQICSTTEANCRQLVRRVRLKVAEEVKSPQSQTTEEQPLQQLVEVLLQSCLEGNHQQLAQYLQQDIALYSDGGGKVVAALNVLHGKDFVSRFMVGIAQKNVGKQLTYKTVRVNNLPAILLYTNGAPQSLFYLRQEGGQLSRVFVMRNPDKIILNKLSQKEGLTDIR